MKRQDTKNNPFTERILKIYSFPTPIYNNIMFAQPNYIRRPYIRLRGKWVEDLGFRVGLSIRVIIFNKCIILIPKEEDPKKVLKEIWESFPEQDISKKQF